MTGKILITGSEGYIGSHLIKKLIIEKYNAIGFKRGDDLDKLIKGCSVVYHTASNVRMTEKVEWKNLDNDLFFTLALLEKCVEYNVRSIIYTSSGGTVYGPSRGPVNEQHINAPICPYGMVKLTVENYIKFFCDLYNFNYVILRIANPYGGNAKKGVIHHILKAVKDNKEFIVWGDGSHVRDFIYIDDLIEAMKLIGLSNQQGVFNIGTGNGTSIKKVIDIIQTETGKKLKVIYKPRRLIDDLYNVLDITKLVHSIKWQPQIDLIKGIKQLVEDNI